ncbi:TetR/AcrR family transcriptional regulator [Nitratireductor sp. ZSWI3]|uniref:TetR/AcrR family transcriptional regulator n=1 Tax=Nitratireductor sp. ZSWI3 TaxID=2966359 RepID=UPI002150348C|nr:TetR/AcrR family transcriptional regulator [Nitratireductor sp. ZSWI3]MCR4267959.1 TetR/AcrR family transcriptional regulator [Nitratireductor sp. ZSWI3]
MKGVFTMSARDDTAPRRQSIGARRNPDTADAIRAAALDVLIEEGHAGFSIEKVARRARAGKPTIYRWWPSKTALLLDVYHGQKRDIEYPVTDDLEHDLVIFLRSLFRHWRDGPSGDIFRSVMAEAQADQTARQAFLKYISERHQRIAEMIHQPRADSHPDMDASILADLILSYAWMRLLTHSLAEPEANIANAVRTMLHGAAPSG